MAQLQEHWNQIFANTEEEKLGWFESSASETLDFLQDIPDLKSMKIFLPGAGTSQLIGSLADTGAELVVNDISSIALEKARQKFTHSNIQWYCGSLVDLIPTKFGMFDLWIDRACLHFFLREEEICQYFENLHRVLQPDAFAFFAEFASEGATRCAQLDVHRYSVEELQTRLPDFALLREDKRVYMNPYGDPRPYIYAIFRNKSADV